MRRRRAILTTTIVVALVALPAATVRALAHGRPPTTTVLTIGEPGTGRTMPAGFLGLSLEYSAIPAYAGNNPWAVDPVFTQLIRNLAGGDPPELRIGGDTTDWTWWPIRGMHTPAGVSYALTSRWTAVTHALAAATGARLTLGINFEADSAAVAATEANHLVARLGRNRIAAFELGNEPELYGTFTWGSSGEPGRAHDYNFAAFSRNFARIARALPPVPLAGPTSGGRRWFRHVGRFLADHRHVTVATLHRYPLEGCYVKPPNPTYPTIAHLLSARSTHALADSVVTAVRQAHAHGASLRVDEMNTVSCGSDPSVGHSFASALWALNVLFQLARVGVDGVNLHTFPGATYALFSFRQVGGQWRGVVNPEYYGLEMFAQAAPAGSRLLSVSRPRTRQLQAYATQDPRGTVRAVVINEGSGARTVDVRVHGASRTGTIELLTAPSIGATSGVTLGGQSYGNSTTTGRLAGARKTNTIAPTRGGYVLSVPPASAVMLTMPPDGGAPLAGTPGRPAK